MSKMSKIYRYNFSNEMMINIHSFSKIHEYDDRKTFKESWKTWIEENEESIIEEVTRLNRLGNDKSRENIIESMYFSARYYHRKKKYNKKSSPFVSAVKSVIISEGVDVVENVGASEKKNIYIQKNTLYEMDKFISENENIKPSDSYIMFCERFKELLNEEIENIKKEGKMEMKDITNKLKKTYKNRYYIFSKK